LLKVLLFCIFQEILKVSKEGPLTDDDDGNFDDGDDDSTSKPSGRKTSLLLADVVDVESTTKVVSVEPCIICLNDYAEGEILCWSQNPKCQHFMHKECASEWLMNHDECPLCRHNYLSLDDDDHDHDHDHDHDEQLDGERNGRLSNRRITGGIMDHDTDQDRHSILRGINLFYALSQLQNLTEARPNTTFRLEGIELADGQRGSVEIQQTTEQSSTLDMGMNIRVMPLGHGVITDQPLLDRRSSTMLVRQGSSHSNASGIDGGLRHEDAPGDTPSPSSQPDTNERIQTISYPTASETADDAAQNDSDVEDSVQ
jgi:hypothetical protein